LELIDNLVTFNTFGQYPEFYCSGGGYAVCGAIFDTMFIAFCRRLRANDGKFGAAAACSRETRSS